ncbi:MULTISPECIES: glycosyl transferase [Microbacterium]|uniref:glycosyl transferase n=2 Tax=Microbacteriaceae TaxID=85023 RepID=UPI000F5E88E1|nr:MULTISPECIES: glycosyl transferase [Microbacterium]AZH77485.1 glycosyl transferase [Microbacterium sp. Y-01]QYG12001.1 glycosyl transferase [Microbacterium sp. PAMC22086]
MSDPRRPLRVMQSFGAPRVTTNPYITMLDEALAATDGIEHVRFSWREALLGRYDVFHWHWPEVKLHGSSAVSSVGKYALTGLLALRHGLSRRIAVVRTVHNLDLPDDNAARLWLLRRIDRQADHRIVLNETTPLPAGTAQTVILHGHYRDWYGVQPRAERLRGRLGTFGGVRRYKGVSGFVDAYADAVARDPEISMIVGGKASSAELAEDLRTRVADLPNVVLELEFLSDAELVQLVTGSELIVLAYRFMHNSGSVLAALSLDRPVLVPRNAPNEALAAEVGPEWVQMYDGEVDADALLEALRAVRAISGDRPDLSRREWDDAGAAHAAAYREALRARLARVRPRGRAVEA